MADKRDYYEVLGVSKSASADENGVICSTIVNTSADDNEKVKCQVADTEVKSGDFASFGTGERYDVSGDGTEEDPYVYQTYSNDAVYYLVNDIAMPSGTRWTVPSGFTGYFTSDDANGEDNSVLRTADTRLYESVS